MKSNTLVNLKVDNITIPILLQSVYFFSWTRIPFLRLVDQTGMKISKDGKNFYQVLATKGAESGINRTLAEVRAGTNVAFSTLPYEEVAYVYDGINMNGYNIDRIVEQQTAGIVSQSVNAIGQLGYAVGVIFANKLKAKVKAAVTAAVDKKTDADGNKFTKNFEKLGTETFQEWGERLVLGNGSGDINDVRLGRVMNDLTLLSNKYVDGTLPTDWNIAVDLNYLEPIIAFYADTDKSTTELRLNLNSIKVNGFNIMFIPNLEADTGASFMALYKKSLFYDLKYFDGVAYRVRVGEADKAQDRITSKRQSIVELSSPEMNQYGVQGTE